MYNSTFLFRSFGIICDADVFKIFLAPIVSTGEEKNKNLTTVYGEYCLKSKIIEEGHKGGRHFRTQMGQHKTKIHNAFAFVRYPCF